VEEYKPEVYVRFCDTQGTIMLEEWRAEQPEVGMELTIEKGTGLSVGGRNYDKFKVVATEDDIDAVRVPPFRTLVVHLVTNGPPLT
jgi:hypothetical protein